MTRALSGHTRPFAVLGHPIGHTLSPIMHNAALEALGMDAVYLAFDVAPARLMEVLHAMAAMGFGGVNLTVPLKETAFRGLTDLDATARRGGAVNTVEFTANGLRGHSTDGEGFLRALDEAFGARVEGDTVFMLGCGGAGRTLALTCAAAGARRLILADVDAERIDRLSRELAEVAPGVDVASVGHDRARWGTAAREGDLVVQATPVGMDPADAPLLRAADLREGQRLFELVYMFPETAIMREARQAGARTANGLGMLLHQGARAFEIWTGVTPPVACMRRVLEEAVYAD